MTQMTMKIRSRQRAVPMALSFSSWLGRPAIHTLRDVDKDVNARREAEHYIGPRHAAATAAMRGGLAAICYAAGISTNRPTTLPFLSSFSASLTVANGRVPMGRSGAPLRRTRSSNSLISERLPT